MRLLLLALLTSPSPPAAAAPAVADPWQAAVFARLRDGARAFRADGEAWKAASPETRIQGTFDLDGAWLEHEGARIGVRTARWGRAGALEVVSPTALGLGACALGQEEPAGACVRRLELQSAGLTESWSSTDQGFAQEWTVETPPGGDGDLLLDVVIEGATTELGDGELLLNGEDGGTWIVSGFSAWDADGVPLALRIEEREDGYRVRLRDAAARYPVTIDPGYGTPITLAEDSGGGGFGFTVSGAGDVDGDGYDDVIVGSLDRDGTDYAFVYHGSASGVSTTATTTLTGELEENLYAYSVSGAGDVNADGYDDVIVGSLHSAAYDYWGVAYVYHGSASGISTVAAVSFAGEETRSYFGRALSGAGDVDGNGYDDLVVGASAYDSRGKAYVYHSDGDLDGDAVLGAEDCDDGDATVYPGAAEVACDCVDQDCDGEDLRDGCETAETGGLDPCDDSGGAGTGGGDSGDDDTGRDTGDADTADSDTSAGDSADGEDGDSEPRSEAAEDDTAASPADDDPAKEPPGCGCAATNPAQGAPALALLPLLALRRRSRASSRTRPADRPDHRGRSVSPQPPGLPRPERWNRRPSSVRVVVPPGSRGGAGARARELSEGR